MIRKNERAGTYSVLSEKGRHMGTYATRAEAEKRLKDIEMFKHMREANNKGRGPRPNQKRGRGRPKKSESVL